VTLLRRVTAEFAGTAMLLAIVVGSGIMGERLAGGNAALALLGNSIATGAGLIVLIHMFGPVSGAHFNPVVTLAVALDRKIPLRIAAGYAAAQFAGAIIGVWLTHAMFAEPILQISDKPRAGLAQGLSEAVATFGLIGTIISVQRHRAEFTPVAVGLYIVAGYWFTASTCFANPAVTIARTMSDSFSGITPHAVPLFIAGQLAGMGAAVALFTWLFREDRTA